MTSVPPVTTIRVAVAKIIRAAGRVAARTAAGNKAEEYLGVKTAPFLFVLNVALARSP